MNKCFFSSGVWTVFCSWLKIDGEKKKFCFLSSVIKNVFTSPSELLYKTIKQLNYSHHIIKWWIYLSCVTTVLVGLTSSDQPRLRPVWRLLQTLSWFNTMKKNQIRKQEMKQKSLKKPENGNEFDSCLWTLIFLFLTNYECFDTTPYVSMHTCVELQSQLNRTSAIVPV